MKCDDCKVEIRRTEDIAESYAGGRCEACKPPVRFEVGKTYRMRSIGDYNCVWDCTVLSRTAKQLTLAIDGEKGDIRRGITVWNGVERCSPFGRYSMSPQISADREAK